MLSSLGFVELATEEGPLAKGAPEFEVHVAVLRMEQHLQQAHAALLFRLREVLLEAAGFIHRLSVLHEVVHEEFVGPWSRHNLLD